MVSEQSRDAAKRLDEVHMDPPKEVVDAFRMVTPEVDGDSGRRAEAAARRKALLDAVERLAGP